MTSWIEELGNRAVQDEYFIDIFTKMEIEYADSFINGSLETTLNNKEFIDILRFADILSKSQDSFKRNLAYRIVSLLYDKSKGNIDYLYFSNSILIELGNFPAIKFIDDNSSIKVAPPLESTFEKIIKQTIQNIPNTEYSLTDTQYTIFEALKKHNHFSFSGPTSLGKSFIMENFIKNIINFRNGIDNIVILVPTRALIKKG